MYVLARFGPTTVSMIALDHANHANNFCSSRACPRFKVCAASERSRCIPGTWYHMHPTYHSTGVFGMYRLLLYIPQQRCLREQENTWYHDHYRYDLDVTCCVAARNIGNQHSRCSCGGAASSLYHVYPPPQAHRRVFIRTLMTCIITG